MWLEQSFYSDATNSDSATINIKSTMTLEYMLSQAVMTHFPVKVVIEPKLARIASGLIGHENLILLSDPRIHSVDSFGYTLAVAISEYADVNGWLLLTAQTPFIRSQTLKDVAIALDEHILVYPQYGGQQGYPIGFNGELFSELVRLNSEQDLMRLMVRYPSFGIEVDDPGVLPESSMNLILDKKNRLPNLGMLQV